MFELRCGSVTGPVVPARQSGFEQRKPTRAASTCFTRCGKSSRILSCRWQTCDFFITAWPTAGQLERTSTGNSRHNLEDVSAGLPPRLQRQRGESDLHTTPTGILFASSSGAGTGRTAPGEMRWRQVMPKRSPLTLAGAAFLPGVGRFHRSMKERRRALPGGWSPARLRQSPASLSRGPA